MNGFRTVEDGPKAVALIIHARLRTNLTHGMVWVWLVLPSNIMSPA